MDIRELRERIIIQRATATRDDYNAEVLTWSTTVATVWAKVVERGGREPVIADRPVMLVSYEITIRDGVAVTHMDRISWRSKTLSIDTVTPLPSQGLLVLRCLEAG